MAYEYHITVVDGRSKSWSAKGLVRQTRVPVGVAARWHRVRREMSPAGLKRKLSEQRN
jgi:hypothetical protein